MTDVLDDAARVLRIVRRVHVSPSESSPTHEAFVPSSADREHAAARHEPVRLSVWDVERITLARAAATRATTESLYAFTLRAGVIALVGREHGQVLQTVRDPDGCTDSDPTVRDAHCGIEGLERPSGVGKVPWRVMLSRLADDAVPAHRG